MDDLKIETSGEKSIAITRTFSAPKEKVYKAWTTPSLLQQWMLGPDGWTMPHCEVDLKVGGKYRFVWRNTTNGMEMAIQGTYLEIVPCEKLVATEKFDDAWNGGGATSTLVLTETNGVTATKQVIEYESPEVRDQVLRSPMESGLRASYNRLQTFFDNGGEA